MYIIGSSIDARERILREDFNIPVINGNSSTHGKTPVTATVEKPCFEPYHFGAKIFRSAILDVLHQVVAANEIQMRGCFAELENETSPFEDAVLVARFDLSLVSKGAPFCWKSQDSNRTEYLGNNCAIKKDGSPAIADGL